MIFYSMFYKFPYKVKPLCMCVKLKGVTSLSIIVMTYSNMVLKAVKKSRRALIYHIYVE